MALRATTLERRSGPSEAEPEINVNMPAEDAARLTPERREQLHAALLELAADRPQVGAAKHGAAVAGIEDGLA